jgi:hypothetical protein
MKFNTFKWFMKFQLKVLSIEMNLAENGGLILKVFIKEILAPPCSLIVNRNAIANSAHSSSCGFGTCARRISPVLVTAQICSFFSSEGPTVAHALCGYPKGAMNFHVRHGNGFLHCQSMNEMTLLN